jgi:hypothetical protein
MTDREHGEMIAGSMEMLQGERPDTVCMHTEVVVDDDDDDDDAVANISRFSLAVVVAPPPQWQWWWCLSALCWFISGSKA